MSCCGGPGSAPPATPGWRRDRADLRFFCRRLAADKPDPAVHRQVTDLLVVPPGQIGFADGSADNVKAALARWTTVPPRDSGPPGQRTALVTFRAAVASRTLAGFARKFSTASCRSRSVIVEGEWPRYRLRDRYPGQQSRRFGWL